MIQLRKNIASSDSGFIFNPATGDSYSANPIAADILHHLKSGKSVAEIKTLILGKFDVEAGQLEKDWDDFIAQLREANLTEN
ncbi:MAG: PqqD family protein [Sphingobacteriales bacterium]|jgi:hypothetical protein|nr:PqqD family protein [Sphingobacteriales bacterium]